MSKIGKAESEKALKITAE